MARRQRPLAEKYVFPHLQLCASILRFRWMERITDEAQPKENRFGRELHEDSPSSAIHFATKGKAFSGWYAYTCIDR